MTRLVGILILCASFLIGWWWMDYQGSVDAPAANAEPAVFEIAKGWSLSEIAMGLRKKGLIRNTYWFKILAWREKVGTRLKYGEYEIAPHATMRQMVALFASGKVRQHGIAFIEGWGFRQMLEALNHHPALSHGLQGKAPEEIMGLIGAPGENAEGRFYPDTYHFTKGASDIEMLKRAYRKMQTVLADEWQGRSEGLPLISPYEALILASIVEKETARAEERPRIAGVFNRRLAMGMPLQTDPSVIYGLGESYDGNIRKQDLQQDTPYNTYLHPGLPPTPIAMPGLEAIHATLHPDAGDSLYFVAQGDGWHVFSRTLEEHNKAVDQFQRKRHE